MDASVRSLHSQSSRDSGLLVELDPSPMDSPLPQSESEQEEPATGDEAALPDTEKGTAAGTGTTGVGLSGASVPHSRIYYLMRLQRYSSFAFSAFAVLHLATTSLIPLASRSVAASESYLLLAREIYQTPLSEPLLIGLPVAVHVAAGLGIRLLRRNRILELYGDRSHTASTSSSSRPEDAWNPSQQSSPREGKERRREGAPITITHRLRKALAPLSQGWPPVSTISLSGYGFLALFSAHAFLNRGLPLAVEGDSANVGLAFVSHGFARHALLSWAAYTGLLALGCGHMVWGWARWTGLAQRAGTVRMTLRQGGEEMSAARRRKQRVYWLAINGVAIAVTGLWAAGGLGIVARGGLTQGWVGDLYDGLYGKVFFWGA